MLKRLGLLIVMSVLLALPAAAQEDIPRFEKEACPFDAPTGRTAECGFVVVPEDRSDPDNTNTIRIAVVNFKAENAPADPIMLLSGGPGEKTVVNAPVYFALTGSVAGERDFILFDQRGVGQSEPALECPEFVEALLAGLNSTDSDANAKNQYDALVNCGERLTEEGYNLAAFNTRENAADVSDIATALGYEQVNLLGISYGSLLAQAVMRDYPAVVRSAVIDSILPLNASLFLEGTTSVFDALDRLLAACAAEMACDTAYPNLREVLFATIDELNTNPVDVTLTNPATGETVPAKLTGDTVLGNLAFFLYQAPILPQLPRTIYALSEGDYELMTQLSGFTLAAYGALSRGMQFSVQCAEDLIGQTPEDYLEQIMALPPQYRGNADIEQLMEYGPFATCEKWPVVPLDAGAKAALVSDIPALLLGGEFDPVTPSSNTVRLAETLTNAFVYIIPGIGHSANTSSECARTITASFLNDPTTTPEDSCLDALTTVQFEVPGGEAAAPEPVTLVTFSDEAMNISGLVPEGWQLIGAGTYVRGSNALDQTALIVQAAPAAQADVIASVSEQFGLGDSSGLREANGLTWTLYEGVLQSFPLNAAFAQDGETTLLVVLVSGTEAERAALVESVFYPAVDALTPGT